MLCFLNECNTISVEIIDACFFVYLYASVWHEYGETYFIQMVVFLVYTDSIVLQNDNITHNPSPIKQLIREKHLFYLEILPSSKLQSNNFSLKIPYVMVIQGSRNKDSSVDKHGCTLDNDKLKCVYWSYCSQMKLNINTIPAEVKYQLSTILVFCSSSSVSWYL